MKNWELSFKINDEMTFALYSDDNVFIKHEKESIVLLKNVIEQAKSFLDGIPEEPVK